MRCSARSFVSARRSAARRLSSSGVAPRGRVPAMGRMVTSPLAHAHQDFRARARDREASEVQEIEERRGVDAAQRAVEREGRQVEARLEALRQHDLEDVAGRDVLFRLGDHRHVVLGRHVRGCRRERAVEAIGGRRMRDPGFERVLDLREPLHGAVIGGFGRDALLRAYRGDDGHLVLHGVENDHDRGPHQKRVGHAHGIGLVRTAASRPAARCRSSDSRTRPPTWAANARGSPPSRASSSSRSALSVPALQGWNASASLSGIFVDLGAITLGAPQNVGIEADDRITAPDGAAFDGFEEERVRPVCGELQHRRDGRLKIGDQLRGDKLGCAFRIALGEFGKRRLDLHGLGNPLGVEYRGSCQIRPVASLIRPPHPGPLPVGEREQAAVLSSRETEILGSSLPLGREAGVRGSFTNPCEAIRQIRLHSKFSPYAIGNHSPLSPPS